MLRRFFPLPRRRRSDTFHAKRGASVKGVVIRRSDFADEWVEDQLGEVTRGGERSRRACVAAILTGGSDKQLHAA